MSDPFSIIAGVCGLAVQIVDTGLKIKKLYEQFDGAPSSLADTIDLIQLHAADLNPTIPLGDQADIPLQTAAVLAVSKAYCQKVLEELQGVAGELHAQLEKAQGRGGARRRLAALKIVLKKDVLAQHEARLIQASGLLMQAKLSYIITLVQQLRVEIRTPDARIPASLPAPEQRLLLEPPKSGSGQVTTANTTASKTRLSSCQSGSWPSRLLGPSRRIGLAGLTGCVEIHVPARRCQCPRCPDAVTNAQDSENDYFWLKLWLPQWMCNLVIETTIIQSTRGWLYHMATRRVLDSTTSMTVLNAIYAGDIPRLRRLFQTREVAPRDLISELVWPHSPTFVEASIRGRQWTVAAFLLDCGADAGTLTVLRNPPNTGSHALRPRAGCSKFTRKRGFLSWGTSSTTICGEQYLCSPEEKGLQACQAALDSTLDEDDFLSSSFALDRRNLASQQLAWRIPDLQPSLWLTDKYKRLLSGVMDTSEVLRPEKYEIYVDVVRQMSFKFARMWWEAPEVFAAYRALFEELISREKREYYGGDVSWEILHSCQIMLRGLWLQHELYQEPPAHCLDQLIYNWFEMVLGTSGIDGEGVADLVEDLMEWHDREYHLWELFWWEESPRQSVRLINVRGGPRPEDWKFWWSQHTDGLVGDFWSLVERGQGTGFLEEEPLCAIPGAWVE
ncbi:hypothetical protein MAPG_07276 [Magnaporthiopsis poae ATCC 64411]|uniref:NACHT-NTPase and P-loop NTPases N-terminal domain-containing protein n=1 Tax=Magnaporthiopsis poae (strain ATCC 64411 / 73-15) TaxID=644358 RepID=A0A0C4E485_MAGP6|nr:hypothetical protein MAPG_07276 [Magnaporthiopsis poae ATCC 64411]